MNESTKQKNRAVRIETRYKVSVWVVCGTIAGAVLLQCRARAGDVPCPWPGSPIEESTDFSFEAGAVTGAVGDVVGVSFVQRNSLSNITAGHAAVCYDPTVVELEGDPVYSEELISVIGPTGVSFYPVDERLARPWPEPDEGFGFFLWASFDPTAYAERFVPGEPVLLMTVYFRIVGQPGETSSISFCDFELARSNARCLYSFLYGLDNIEYMSPLHRAGSVTVVEGPATQTERPPEPPAARVYPEAPTAEEANFRVRIPGVVASAGARGVAVEVYATADVEYTGLLVPVEYDERYLRLERAEDHLPAAMVLADEEHGNVVFLSAMRVGTRRLGEAGEELHVGTLWFEVLERAREVASTELSVEMVLQSSGIAHAPALVVRHEGGDDVLGGVTRTEIAPLRVARALMQIVEEGELHARRGDVNADGEVDLSDAVGLLNHLYLESSALCPRAGDVVIDGVLNLTDVLGVLNHLFQNGPRPEGETTCAGG